METGLADHAGSKSSEDSNLFSDRVWQTYDCPNFSIYDGEGLTSQTSDSHKSEKQAD